MSEFAPVSAEIPLDDVVETILNEVIDEFTWEGSCELLPTRYELLEKWIGDHIQSGILLSQVNEAILQLNVLIEAIERFGEQAYGLLTGFLMVVSLPLVEQKSNERLTIEGQIHCDLWFTELARLWSNCSDDTNHLWLKSLSNFFLQPELDGTNMNLTSMMTLKWTSNQHNRDIIRLPIIDLNFLLERLEKNNLLCIMILKFRRIVVQLKLLSKEKNIHDDAEEGVEKNQSIPICPDEEDLTIYGLPPRVSNFNDTINLEKTSIKSNEMTVSSLYDWSGQMIDLFLHITSSSPKCSVTCAKNGLLNVATILLEKDFAFDPRSHRVSLIVELHWDLLEAVQDYATTEVARERSERASRSESLPTKTNLIASQGGEGGSISSLAYVDGAPPDDFALRHYLRDNLRYIVNLERTARILSRMLTWTIDNGIRQTDKELRNEVLILLILLSEYPGASSIYTQYRILDTVVTYSCVEEVRDGSLLGPVGALVQTSVKDGGAVSSTSTAHQMWPFFNAKIATSRSFATTSDIDLEAKRQFWILLSSLLRESSPHIIACIASSPMLSVMFAYLEYDSALLEATGNGTMGGSLSRATKRMVDGHSASLYQATQDQLAARQDPKWKMKSTTLVQQVSLHDPLAASSLMKSGTMNSTSGANTQLLLGIGKRRTLIGSLTQSRLGDFQLAAMKFLDMSAPRMLREFSRLNGPARLLALISRFATSTSPEHQNVVFHALLLLYKAISQSREICASMLSQTNPPVVSLLLSLLTSMTSESLRAQVARLLALLCDTASKLSSPGDENAGFAFKAVAQQQIRTFRGLSLLLSNLKEYIANRPPLVGTKAGVKLNLQQSNEPISNSLDSGYGGEISVYIVAVLDCIRASVVGNDLNEIHFAQIDGIDMLLNLLEVSPFILRLQVLRIVSDLLLNSTLVPFVHSWRSPKTLRSAAQMLCHAWLDEEVRLDCERKENGVICDLHHPLGYQSWPVSQAEAPLTGFPPYYAGRGAACKPGVTLGAHTAASATLLATTAQSSTVSRLASAILVGRNSMQTNLPVYICVSALQRDSRALISHVFYNLGVYEQYRIHDEANPFKAFDMEGDQTESPHENDIQAFNSMGSVTSEGKFDEIRLNMSERQVLAIAYKFLSLREGDWWREVQDNLSSSFITPIEEDREIIDIRLEHSFDTALATQIEHLLLSDENQLGRLEGERTFLAQILTKKEQQIKAEYLKRRARGTLKRRKKPVEEVPIETTMAI